MFYNLYKSLAGKSIAEEKVIEAPRLVFSCPVNEASQALFSKDGKPVSPFFTKLHGLLEGWPLAFTVLAFLMLTVGGLVQIIPMLLAEHPAPLSVNVKPYTPLELAGRDIYIREGCYNCHSQQVRPIVEEEKRYGPVSHAYEYIYDRPFQWGSKRTGPDLHRVGGKYPDLWHFRHLEDPRSTSPKSLMPSYAWLSKSRLDTSDIKARLKVLKKLGTPYSEDEMMNAVQLLKTQATEVASRLKEQGGIDGIEDREVIALIAYLQRLGKDSKVAEVVK